MLRVHIIGRRDPTRHQLHTIVFSTHELGKLQYSLGRGVPRRHVYPNKPLAAAFVLLELG